MWPTAMSRPACRCRAMGDDEVPGVDPGIEPAWREGLRPDPLLTVSAWADSTGRSSSGLVAARALAHPADAAEPVDGSDADRGAGEAQL